MADVLSVIQDVLNQDKQQKKEQAKIMREVNKKLKEKKGDKGFGYDPIFKIKNYCQTLAEVSFEERMKISHRAKSTQEMLKHLNQLYK